MVTIRDYGRGTCIWCQKEREGVELTTEDHSFVGFLCFADVRRMLRLKCGGKVYGRDDERNVVTG